MDVYGLKYTSGNIIRNGVTYELRILQRNYTGEPLEIGDVQSLGVEIQSGSGGVDQPIIKTLLHFTVVDSVDMGVVDGVKHGGWEEFYTPDATLYKVRLLRDGVIIWAGCITPDSWSDSLVYRGSVTITARDNVGHMADFEFSKAVLLEKMSYLGGEAYNRVRDDNLVSIYELTYAAFIVAGVDMPLRHQWDADDANKEPHMKAGTYDVLDWLVDIDALAELNWYEAVEKVLASAGLALRYCGKDGICIMNLRALHKMGSADAPVRNVNFINRSGHRTLEPAFKQIVERLDYDSTDGYEAKWAAGDFAVAQKTIDGMVHFVSYLTASSAWTQNNSEREVMRYGEPEHIGSDVAGEEDRYMLVAGRPAQAPTSPTDPQGEDAARRINYIDLDNYVASPGKRLSPNTIMSVGFEVAHSYTGFNGASGFSSLSPFLPCGAIRYAIVWRAASGSNLSLVGSEWVEGVAVQEVTIPAGDPNSYGGVDKGAAEAVAVSHNFQTPGVPGFLELRIYPFRIDLEEPTFGWSWLDAHVRLGNITFDINTEAIPRYFKTTTVYDETQNKTLKRNVDFGAVPTRFSTAGTIRNGFYKPDAENGYPSIMDCHWDGDSTELPLPVLNHLQILSLHAKANSVLTGELRDANGQTIRLDAVWQYAGRTFLLLAGIWNIFTDRIQNAILREYDTYAAAIGSISADYTTDLSGGDARLLALQKSVNAAASLAKNAGGTPGGGGGSTVAWGTVSNNKVPLTVDGSAKTVLLDGWTELPSVAAADNGKVLKVVNGVWTKGDAGGGTVTRVAMTVPTGFSVSGSPITGDGTLEVTLNSQTKNKVLASPSNASGVPSFRALVAADLPDVSGKYVTLATQQDITGAKTFKSNPVNIDSSSSLKVNGSSFIEIGDARIEYDSGSKALRVTKRSGTNQTIGFYADGFVSAKGVAASPSRDIVFIDGAQTISGLKTFAAALALLSTLDINGVTLTGSSSKLSVNKNTEFSGISNVSGGKISIQNLLDRIIALENIVNG